MKQMKLIMILAMLLPIAASAQEERIDTVIPKFLSNGYFFREMPQLPDGRTRRATASSSSTSTPHCLSPSFARPSLGNKFTTPTSF